jgi:nicotinamide-nucleotide amidase
LSKPLEFIVGELLRERGLWLAVAESCTGGLLSHLITNVPGSSAYFKGGVTAYANEAKVHLLGVKWETLENYGAVSAETVIEMARGVRTTLDADIGVSTSGIAGPGWHPRSQWARCGSANTGKPKLRHFSGRETGWRSSSNRSSAGCG